MKNDKEPNPEIIGDVYIHFTANTHPVHCDWTKCQYWSKCSSGNRAMKMYRLR